jgi:DNA polymerase I-like protein with 3'-5' exonuclease and polymerase domains
MACLKKYPGFHTYHKKQKCAFEQTGRAYTPFGRSRLIQSIPQAANTPIQSAGSDICLTSIILLHKAGFDLRFTVHDSITIQTEIEGHEDQAAYMKEIMEGPIDQMNGMSFPVKISCGTNWYDLKEIKP